MTIVEFQHVKTRLARLGVLLALTLAGPMLAICAPARTLSEEATRDLEERPGVVKIYVPLSGEIKQLGVSCSNYYVTGTGFIFRPDGYILTNGHVTQLAYVKDADAKLARSTHIAQCLLLAYTNKKSAERNAAGQPALTDQEKQAYWQVILDYLKQGKIEINEAPASVQVCLDNKQCFSGEIKAYSDPFIGDEITNPGKDVSIIKIDGHDLPTVPFGDSEALRVNDPIEVIGYPGTADISSTSAAVATSTTGIISALKRWERPDMEVLQTSTVINPGNSGGPAFDRQGKVIGIATFKSGESYSYLVPLSVAMEFVHQSGVEPKRGAFDDLWGKALQAYSDGDWVRAHKLLQDVLEMMPDQPEAARLEREAATEAGKLKPPGLLDTVGGPNGAAAIAAAIVILAVVAWFLMRRRSQFAPMGPGGGGTPVGDAAAARVVSVQGPARSAESAPALGSASQNYGSLQASGGPLSGNTFPVPKEGLLIGRDASRCRIVVNEDAVSGEHAWVVPLDNGVVLIDRNSSNGTFLNSPNSARVSKVLLRNGDRVYLGTSTTTVLTYHGA